MRRVFREKNLLWSGVTVLLCLFCFHLMKVATSSVDILYFDEWPVWWGWDGHSKLAWLFLPYNEFLLVPTKALILFSEYFLSGDVRPLIIVNFLLYGCILFWFLAFARFKASQ